MKGRDLTLGAITRSAAIVVLAIVAASGCKAGRNGFSTLGPQPKDRAADRSVSHVTGTPLSAQAFLSLIGAKDLPELKALPPSVQVLLASQTIVTGPASTAASTALSDAPSAAAKEAAVVAPPQFWDGRARGGVAADAAATSAAAVPGWIWEPPTPAVDPQLGVAPGTVSAAGPAEKPPIEKAPINQPPVEQSPVEVARPIVPQLNDLPAAKQPEGRAQLSLKAVAPVEGEKLKREELLLIAFLVVLSVILATFYALLRYRAEHDTDSANEWRRLR